MQDVAVVEAVEAGAALARSPKPKAGVGVPAFGAAVAMSSARADMAADRLRSVTTPGASRSAATARSKESWASSVFRANAATRLASA